MKKLLSYLIIIFFSSLTLSFSEDISDFQIEGISVGFIVDDYFTEETLNLAKETEGTNLSGGISGGNNYEVNIPVKNLEEYDDVKVSYITSPYLISRGKNFITEVTGIKYYKKNNCEGKQKEAVNAVKKVLEGDYKLEKKANTNLKQFTFHLENGGGIIVACYQKDKTNNDIDWISALLLKLKIHIVEQNNHDLNFIVGQNEPDLNFNASVSNEAKTGSDLIKIRPTQAEVGNRIKF